MAPVPPPSPDIQDAIIQQIRANFNAMPPAARAKIGRSLTPQAAAAIGAILGPKVGEFLHDYMAARDAGAPSIAAHKASRARPQTPSPGKRGRMAGLLAGAPVSGHETYPGMSPEDAATPGPSQGGGVPGAPAQAPGRPGAGPRKATPAEQAGYNAFVGAAYKIIYSDRQLTQQLLQRLAAGSDYAGNLGQVAAMVAIRAYDAVRAHKIQIGAPALVHGGREIITDLADLAAKQNIHQFTPDEMKEGFQRAVTVFLHVEMQRGNLDRATLQKLAELGSGNGGGMGIHDHMQRQAMGFGQQPDADDQGGAPEPGEGTPEEEEQDEEEQQQGAGGAQ